MTYGEAYDTVVSAPNVWLGPLRRSQPFRDFINNVAQAIVDDIAEEQVTINTLMEAHYLIAKALADRSNNKRIHTTATSLAQYKDAKFFLELLGTSEEEYCLQMPGLTEEQFRQMQSGELTIGELYKKNPLAILGPILPKNQYQVN